MQLKDAEPRRDGRRFSLEDQARALGVVLREEFGVPFAFFDLETGAEVHPGDAGIPTDGAAETPALDLAAVRDLAADGRSRVTPVPAGRFRLALLLYEARVPVLVAAGEVAAVARSV